MVDVTLKALTPLHIGTGNKYFPNEFTFIQDSTHKYLVRVNMEKQFAIMTDSQRDEFLSDMDTDFELRTFNKKHDIDSMNVIRYKARLLTSISGLRDVREFIKTTDRPYIPGSSIKGAIRTALLWKYASKNSDLLIGAVDNELNKSRRRPKKETFCKQFDESAFSYYTERSGRFDAKYDLMKFLLISDFMSTGMDLDVLGVKTYSYTQNRMVPKPFVTNAEVAPPGSEFTGSIGISPQLTAALNGIGGNVLDHKLVEFFGVSSIEPDSPNILLNRIKEVMKEFNKWCLGKEKNLGEMSGFTNLNKACRYVDTQLGRLDLLRVGFGVGTIYQTVIGLLEESEPWLAIDVINKLRLGKYPRRVELGRVSPPYPKTVELTDQDYNTGVPLPLGWIAW